LPPIKSLALPAALLLASACLSLATGCSRAPEAHTIQGYAMGSMWSVRFAMPDDTRGVEGLRGDIEEALDLVDRQMSTYRDDSDLSRFNQLEAGESMVVPEAFAQVLEASLQLAELSEGHFDPTIGPLVNLWGFGPHGRRDEPPSDEEVEAAMARVGWYRLSFDPATRELIQPGDAYLDFSAIAKGYAADLVAERLRARGIHDFIVDLSGDMVISGKRPDGNPWRIAVERPDPETRDIFTIIELGDRAIATSGSYRNYFEYGEQTFSHTIDPHTGRPIPQELVSVTVVHDNCMMADGLATAITALGADAGYEFAREHGIAALLLIADEDRTVIERMTHSFAEYLPVEY
jgi:FAD:protein FMN transferase